MRRTRQIYKRRSRSNLETLIILIGAIIILSVAFYMAREKSFLPPEDMQIAQGNGFKEEKSQNDSMNSEEAEISSAPESTVQIGKQETSVANNTIQEGMPSTSTAIKKEELVTKEEGIPGSAPVPIINPVEEPTKSQTQSESTLGVTEQTIKQSDEATLSSIFTVQVGYFSVEKNARSLAEKIQTQGFQTFIFKHNNAYKVQVGAYNNRVQAEKASQELKRLGYEVWITQR